MAQSPLSRRDPLWVFSVRTTPKAENPVREFLAQRFEQQAVSYTDFQTGKTTVSVYLAQEPDWSWRKKIELLADLQRLRAFKLEKGRAPVRLRKLRSENWAESWKRHFKPIEIGSTLLIRPTWSKRRARKGMVTVVLDPGLSFGTGLHPTTAFCLEQLVALRGAYQRKSFLDLGTGSGILAIAAAKLNYVRITAIDCDSDAVRTAKANARRNHVAHKISFLQQDLRKLPPRPSKKYSLVCANLVSNLLLSEKQRILSLLEKDGVLVLSGILKTEFSEVAGAYEKAGLRLIRSKTLKEWRSGAFERGKPPD